MVKKSKAKKAGKARKVVAKVAPKQTVKVTAPVAAPVPPVAVAAPAPAPAPKPEPVTMQINAKVLRAMRYVAAKGDIRYYLNGVFFSATKSGGKVYAATDGHRIGVIQEPWANGEEPLDVSLIIPRGVCENATPLLKKSAIAILKQVDKETWTLQGGGEIQQTFKAIDGKFPEWQRVVPDKVSGQPGAYNWRYLHEFDLLARDAFGPSTYSCALQQNGDGAALVTCGLNSFLGVIMPMRNNGAAIPQWAKDVQRDNLARKAKEAAQSEKRALDEIEALAA